jgi:hypothetical protein
MNSASTSVAHAPVATQENLLNIDKLVAARLERDPYDHLVVPGFLDPEVVDAINRDYPQIPSAGNKDYESYPHGPVFDAFIEQLTSPQMYKALGDKFGVDLSDCTTTVTVRTFSELSDGNIHTDHWSKVITVLVYFNEGWSGDGGQLRILRSKDDIEDYAAQIPPLAGGLTAFRRCDHSFHGYVRYAGPRRMVQMSWIRPSKVASVSQRLSRLATRAMKLITRGSGRQM